jgi:hypothetical protein
VLLALRSDVVTDHLEEWVVEREQGHANRALRLGGGRLRICGARGFVAPSQERERAGEESKESKFHPEFPFGISGWHPIYTQSPPLGLF